MSAALPASQAATSPLRTSSAPVPSTMARSSSFATGHGRCSSVSNTSLSAARTPPNRRDENHTNSGRPNAVSRPRWRTTPLSALSTAWNARSVPPPGVVGRKRASSSCRSTCWVVTWCWTREPTTASSRATKGMTVSSRSNDRRSRETGCCPRRPPRACGGRRRSPTDASRLRPSRDRLVLLGGPGERLGAAPAALRLGETALQRFAGRGGRGIRRVVAFEQLPELVHLLARQLAQPAQPARQLAAGRLALGSEQEAHHRPDPETEQEGPEPGAALVHSPASRSSGAATATARGSAWDCSGGRTKRSTTAQEIGRAHV